MCDLGQCVYEADPGTRTLARLRPHVRRRWTIIAPPLADPLAPAVATDAANVSFLAYLTSMLAEFAALTTNTL